MPTLGLIKGSQSGRRIDKQRSGPIESAVHRAMADGYVVGRQVRIGKIAGIVVGYNIASFGQFLGAAYPLVVFTPFGISKCSLAEVSLA